MNKRILFLSHQASRTGAPFLLLHFLRWLKGNSDLTWEVIFGEGGALLPEFEALSPTTVWKKVPSRLDDLEDKMRRRLGQPTRQWQNRFAATLAAQFSRKQFDLIYSNTLTNGAVLHALADLSCPVICHVHELEYTIDHHIGQAAFDLSDAHTNHYIAASNAVKENLIRHHATPATNIDVVHEFVPVQTSSPAQLAQARQNVRRELGIPQDAAVVVGSGTIDWRKGSDLWVQMAIQVARHSPLPVHFIWVGGPPRPEDTLYHLRYDVAQAGLSDRVHFPGARINVLDYFAAADVFAMTSREDPYPLVNLEAASVGLPLVCFHNAGGTPELIEDDCGFVVPYLDVTQMVERICELLDSRELRQQMGERAAQKVRERHDVAVSAPQIYAVLQRCLSNAS